MTNPAGLRSLSFSGNARRAFRHRSSGRSSEDDDDVRTKSSDRRGEMRGASWSGSTSTRERRRKRLKADVSIEVADSTRGGRLFRMSFGQGSLSWDTPGFRAHRVELFASARGDFAGSLPGQRWSAFWREGYTPDVRRFSSSAAHASCTGQVGYLIPIPQVSARPSGGSQRVRACSRRQRMGRGREPELRVEFTRWSAAFPCSRCGLL